MQTPAGLGVLCKGFAATQLPDNTQSQAWDRRTVGCSRARRGSNAGPLSAMGSVRGVSVLP